MKHNWLLVSAMVLGVTAAASASSINVQFNVEQANPGDTVQLLISGASDVDTDAFWVIMDLTATGSAPEPVPNVLWPIIDANCPLGDPNTVWDFSTTGLGWFGTPVLKPMVGSVVFPKPEHMDPPLPYGTMIWDWDRMQCDGRIDVAAFDSGDILVVEMKIPDDGTYGVTIGSIAFDANEAEFGRAGQEQDVETLGSDVLTILPEPATIGLLALGVVGMVLRRRRR